MDKLLTVQQVAEYLNVSPRTIRRLRLPCVRIGRSVRFERRDVLAWLSARKED